MTLSSYIKEKVIAIILQSLFLVLSFIYLLLYGLSTLQIFPIIFLYLSVSSIYYLLSYRKSKKYLKSIATTLEQLDEKYLFSEIFVPSSSYIDQAFFTIIKEACHSMYEKVSMRDNDIKNYKEYIETWIHEVKQPIAVIHLICEKEKNETTRKILLQLENINHFVEQTLYCARTEVIHQDLTITAIDLKKCICECMQEQKQLLIQNNISVSIPDKIPLAYADEKSMIFIINQIIRNAISYKKEEHATLNFMFEIENKLMRFVIKDNGLGISNNDLHRIFEKGFTGNNGRSNKKSTGLGLYLTKQLCNHMQIEIDISSKINEYTMVTLRLVLAN